MVDPANRIVAKTGLPVPLPADTTKSADTTTKPADTTTKPVTTVDPTTDPVVAKGAGAKNYNGQQPGLGSVEPLSPIDGTDRTTLDDWTRYTDQFRKNGPLVLTDAQLAQLEPGRMGPSNTLKGGDPVALSNFEAAASKVNALVASGQDLTLDEIADLNRTLLSGTDKDPYAGVIRTSGQDVGHRTSNGGFFFYAVGDDVPKYLQDFMTWYHANENVLPPTELAGEAYQQLVRIHPFMDSNGRTTRLVMDWILQRNGLPPAIYTNADSEAVHSSTASVVANTAKATSTAWDVLTTTTDTSAQPGTTIQVQPVGAPSNTKGILGALGQFGP
jgi:fido (protein-threonine AMPylation protein)